MSAFELSEERVNLWYEGPYLKTMWWILITTVVSILIIPAAWATAFLYRRVVSLVVFSDGTAAAFQGLAGRVWGWFVIVGVLSLAPQLIGGIVYNGDPFSLILRVDTSASDSQAALDASGVSLLATLVALPFIMYAQLVIMRWAIDGIELTNGPDLSFMGRYLPLLGWVLFFIVSFITIIGWAWVATAFLRWFARNIEGAGVRFQFVGSGWGLLWRVLGITVVALALAATVVLSPVLVILPYVWSLWASVWLLKWLMRNVVLFRFTPSPEVTTLEM